MSAARKLCTLALLVAAALLLHFVESRLPQILPIPGVKLGLANIVTVVAMALFSRRDAALVLAARVLLGALFSGRMLTLMYSMAGGVTAFIACALLYYPLGRRRLWAVSIAASIAHVIGQLLAAAFVIGIYGAAAHLPVLIMAAMITGLFTGLCAQFLLDRLNNIKGGMKR